MAEIELAKINGQAEGDPTAFVLACEKKYKDFTREVADRVAKNDRIRMILLAGPSGSGKTTTANMLADMATSAFVQRVNGVRLSAT